MKLTKAISALIIAASLGLTGCGGSDDDNSSSPAPDTGDGGQQTPDTGDGGQQTPDTGDGGGQQAPDPIPAPTPDPTPRDPIVTIPESCNDKVAAEVVSLEWVPEAYTTYEFESAFDGVNGATVGNAPTLVNDGESEHTVDPASGGKMVYLNGNSGKVYLHNIVIPEDGIYEFKIFGNTQLGYKKQHLYLYKEGDLDLEKLEQDQKDKAAFEAEQFEFLQFGDSEWHEFIFRPELSAGTYSFEMKLSWGYNYFDRIDVSSTPARFDSRYGMTQAVRYTSETNDITAPLKLNTNKLVGVSIDGEPADFALNASCDKLTLSNSGLSLLAPGTYQGQVDFDYMSPTTFEIKVIEGEAGGTSGRYEAEDVTLGELMHVRTQGDQGADNADDPASKGGYVTMENTGSMLFYVTVAEAGLYNVDFRYRTANSDKVQDIKVNDEFARPGVGFRASSNRWETASFPMELKAGSNKVEIVKSWGFQDFDYFEVSRELASLTAEITPKQQKLYLDAQKQISIKIDPYGNTLQGATISGTAEGSTVKDLALQYTTEEYKGDIEGRFTSVILGGFFVHLDKAQLATLPAGKYEITWNFDGADSQTTAFDVVAADSAIANDMVVIFFDASHGNAALFLLPTGKSLVVDLGQWWINLDRVIPFLKANNIDPDYLWLTHPHGDHIAGTYKREVGDGFISDGHEAFVNHFPDVMVQRSMHEEDGGDRAFFASGREFDFEDTKVKVLNTFGDSCGEAAIKVNSCDLNANSLAFSMDYRGFVVQFQGDIYGGNQERIMKDYGLDAIKGQIFYGNHHWHGSISPEYVKKADPALIFVPASEVVYARGAFTQDAMEAVNYLKTDGSQYQDMLMSFDSGHVIMRANVSEGGEVSWSYESLKHLAIDLGEQAPDEDLRYPDYSEEQKAALHEMLWIPHLDKWRTPAP